MPSLPQAIGQSEGLDAPARQIQQVIDQLLSVGGASLRNLLNGVWLGHPLHAVLTDVPLGAWTTAACLDAVNDPAADACIGVGLAFVLPTALTGAADYSSVSGAARRVGLVHAGLNILATGLYGASWVKRRQGDRKSGITLSLLGLAAVSLSAFLGGHLVYGERIGVDHSRDQALPDDFIDVMAEAELRTDKPMHADANGTSIVLVRRGSRVFAMGATCAHLGGPLAEGKLENGGIRCPWHGSLFSLEDGHVLEGPAVHPQPCMEVRVLQGRIQVRLMREHPAQPTLPQQEVRSLSES